MTVSDAKPQIRSAGTDDYEAVMSLYRQLHSDDPPLDKPGRETFMRIIEHHDLHLFLLCCEEQPLASMYLNVIPNLTRGGAPYAVIENVITDQNHRGRGIGRQLMRHVLETAWDLGCYKVMLMTGSSSPATHGFYRACGFDPDDKHAYIARPERARA